MKKTNLVSYFLAIALLAGLSSCEDNDDDNNDPFVANQQDLDEATTKIKEIIGNEYMDFAHGGPSSNPDSSYRIVYSNVSSLGADIAKGTIITKHTFKANANGTKGDPLYVTFAMIKREDGYDPDNDNWEYVQMPNDGTTDYSMNPNGTLPAEGAATRGKLNGCISCHAGAPGSDYVFVND